LVLVPDIPNFINQNQYICVIHRIPIYLGEVGGIVLPPNFCVQEYSKYLGKRIA